MSISSDADVALSFAHHRRAPSLPFGACNRATAYDGLQAFDLGPSHPRRVARHDKLFAAAVLADAHEQPMSFQIVYTALNLSP